MVTLKDVAEKAEVSASTVSRIINSKGDKCASSEVKKRVWDAIRETGYVPNLSAKHLKEGYQESNKSSVIYILFARTRDSRGDSYFLELSSYVNEEILKNGFKAGRQFISKEVLGIHSGDIEIGKHDGLVVLGKTQESQSKFISLFNKRVVYITLNQMNLEEDHIMCDGKQATESALQYLYDHGHHNIAYIGEKEKEIRYIGYREFLIKMRLNSESDYTIEAAMNTEGGYNAAKRLLDYHPMPTAVFCANDITAIGVLKGLKDNNINVPGDISVISIDNIAEAAFSSPALTTVKIPMKEMGSFAVKTLVDRIHKGHKVYIKVFMPSGLIIRESVRTI
ncbi:MAG: LacI family DNA-binding transcriptional regulator [Clostridia bacterium]|nr:LacI family DNA-binding transcriptional regulator [Clostridia bacterium]